MKSGLITPRDPYLMDPFLWVDPNLILDYGASAKDDSLSLSDLINFDDTQLEDIILNSGFCGDDTWIENEFEFEDLLKDIKVQPSGPIAEIDVTPELYHPTIIETEIASVEEVYTCSDEPESVESEDVEEVRTESTDNESIESHQPELRVSTRKRKLSDASTMSYASTTSDASTVVAAPKRRKTRRNKRVQDERVKNQNKMAAMKYRQKKKDEKGHLDGAIELEEEKNAKLKAQVEELKVNIDVLKELLGKYLSPSQMRVNEN